MYRMVTNDGSDLYFRPVYLAWIVQMIKPQLYQSWLNGSAWTTSWPKLFFNISTTISNCLIHLRPKYVCAPVNFTFSSTAKRTSPTYQESNASIWLWKLFPTGDFCHSIGPIINTQKNTPGKENIWPDSRAQCELHTVSAKRSSAEQIIDRIQYECIR